MGSACPQERRIERSRRAALGSHRNGSGRAGSGVFQVSFIRVPTPFARLLLGVLRDLRVTQSPAHDALEWRRELSRSHFTARLKIWPSWCSAVQRPSHGRRPLWIVPRPPELHALKQGQRPAELHALHLMSGRGVRGADCVDVPIRERPVVGAARDPRPFERRRRGPADGGSLRVEEARPSRGRHGVRRVDGDDQIRDPAAEEEDDEEGEGALHGLPVSRPA